MRDLGEEIGTGITEGGLYKEDERLEEEAVLVPQYGATFHARVKDYCGPWPCAIARQHLPGLPAERGCGVLLTAILLQHPFQLA